MAKGKTVGYEPALRWLSWAVGVLAIASAFVPLSGELTRVLGWVLCLFSVIEAALGISHGRRAAFGAYAAVAILVNPFVPFHFASQLWRLLYAGSGLWLIADHLDSP